jgi:hypothetical protein
MRRPLQPSPLEIGTLVVERLALKRLIYDLVEWSQLPDEPEGWICQGLRTRVNEALADLPRHRMAVERQKSPLRVR